jgi:site-specific DNA recombinase
MSAAIEQAATETLACYMRVSSDDQRRKGTIENQRDVVQRYLDKEDVTPYGWYEDDGVTGVLAFGKRPEGRRLLADIQAGSVGVVLVRKLDRFGRNAYEILGAVRQIERAGARLISLKENIDTRTSAGRFFLTVLAGVAQLERDLILERTDEGTARCLREQRWTGGRLPYGYTVEGSKKDARLVVDEDSAPLVRQLYMWLIDQNWSTQRIADELNRMGVPTVTEAAGHTPAERWRANRVHRLLTNPVYMGRFTHGKRRHDGSKGTHQTTVDVPAIIPPERWMAAQDTLARHTRFSRRNAQHDYLLRGLVRCGVPGCGLAHTGVPSRSGHAPTPGAPRPLIFYYVCNGKRKATAYYGRDGKRCLSVAINADWLDS